MEEEEQRSSFWSTVPGILTGVAAVISAATGGYLAFIRMPNAAASDSPHIAAAAELKPAAIAATPKEPSNSQGIQPRYLPRQAIRPIRKHPPRQVFCAANRRLPRA